MDICDNSEGPPLSQNFLLHGSQCGMEVIPLDFSVTSCPAHFNINCDLRRGASHWGTGISSMWTVGPAEGGGLGIVNVPKLQECGKPQLVIQQRGGLSSFCSVPARLQVHGQPGPRGRHVSVVRQGLV